MSNILYIVIMIVATILIFWGGRKFIFSKVKINKWIPLGISIVILASQFFIGNQNKWINAVSTLLTVMFFLWFMEIHSTGGPKVAEKKIVIKPKAKPNRVKHLKK
ncbi:hypothetical protein [Clostridium gasigenes]|uniref:hypothetical protein n=1 Tax=Clostridium gasigenes TaxID=94869 RepID=UPI0014385C40|nr:hypothetical protein [Clostridium gasigenes]NKF07068.1 hypothetical protein [Clostridium gasigenes]